MDDKRFWIGFNLIKGIGAVRMQGLMAYFGELESAWKAAPSELAAAGLGLKVIERVIQARGELERTNSKMTLEMRQNLTRAQWLQLQMEIQQPALNLPVLQMRTVRPNPPAPK